MYLLSIVGLNIRRANRAPVRGLYGGTRVIPANGECGQACKNARQ